MRCFSRLCLFTLASSFGLSLAALPLVGFADRRRQMLLGTS
jgi:hypothetical protein